MSSSSSSSSSSSDLSGLDNLVMSYLNEKGYGKIVKKLAKQMKVAAPSNFLPAGSLASAVAGTRKNERKRAPRENAKPKSSYELFCADRKEKYAMYDSMERRKAMKAEWDKQTPASRQAYDAKRDKARETYYAKFPDKKPTAKESAPKRKAANLVDPKKPKKPKSSYILFTVATRPRVVAENPNMVATEVMSTLGKLWNTATATVKADYAEKYARAKEQFNREMAAYVPDPNYPEPVKEKKTKASKSANGQPAKKKQKRDKNAPKRATSNYLLFQAEQREQMKRNGLTLGATEIISEIAKRWKKLSEVQKHAWDLQVASDKIRFNNEMKTYTPPDPNSLASETKKPKKDPLRPKRAPTAYLLFANDSRAAFIAKHPTLSNPEIMKGIATLWGKQNEAQKAAFEPRVRAAQEKYALAMKTYVPPPVQESSNDTKKRKRDPNAPKKPPTAYLLFSAVRRAQLKKSQPTLGPTDIMKEIGNGWKLLDAAGRTTYESQASAKKIEYDAAMDQHKSRGTSSSSSSVVSTSYSSMGGRRKTALDFYMEARRKKVQHQHPSATKGEQDKILKEKFASLPANRLIKYQNLEKQQMSTGQQAV